MRHRPLSVYRWEIGQLDEVNGWMYGEITHFSSRTPLLLMYRPTTQCRINQMVWGQALLTARQQQGSFHNQLRRKNARSQLAGHSSVEVCNPSNWRTIRAEPLATFRFRAPSPTSICDNVVQTLPSRDCSQPHFNGRQPCCRARSSPTSLCGVVCPSPLPTSRCPREQGPTRFHCWQGPFRRSAVGECLHEHDERSTRVLVAST